MSSAVAEMVLVCQIASVTLADAAVGHKTCVAYVRSRVLCFVSGAAPLWLLIALPTNVGEVRKSAINELFQGLHRKGVLSIYRFGRYQLDSIFVGVNDSRTSPPVQMFPRER